MVVGDHTEGTILKGHSVRKDEKHWARARLAVGNYAMRKMDCWYPQSLIRALAGVCLHVPYATHREVGYLQDSKVSIPGGVLVFPRDGNPPVWGIPTIELNKNCFP